MKLVKQVEKVNALLLILGLLSLVPNVYGYIDMGTGSYVFQLVIAGVLGLLFTFRGYIRVIKTKLNRMLWVFRKKKSS